MPGGLYREEILNGNFLATDNAADNFLCIKNCLKGKKIVISNQCNKLENIYTELTEHTGTKVVVKDYPVFLSSAEYAALLKKDLTPGLQLARRSGFISFLEAKPKSPEEELYLVCYVDYLLIPREYFRQLKGLTEADMHGFKEVELR